MDNLLVDDIVRVVCVPNSVSATQEHLEGDVGNELPHGVQAVPGALVQEPQSHVKRCSWTT